MFYILLPNLSLEAFFAAFSVFVVWLIYRFQRIEERKRIFSSLKAMVSYSGEWFNACYNENSSDYNWYDPTNSVYPVDISQLPSIITSNILSERLINLLSFFIQLVKRFNHRIDIFNNYIYADPALFKKANDFLKSIKGTPARSSFIDLTNLIDANKDEEVKAFLMHVFYLQKMIHKDGIGDRNYYRNDFPKLSLCFEEIKNLIEKEKSQKVGLFRGEGLIVLADVVFLCFPAIVILISILVFIRYHLMVLIY